MRSLMIMMVVAVLALRAGAATTWYVTKSGKDTNTGKSESAAFLTIQKAVNSSVAGDTIIVGDGSFSPISTSNKKITIKSKNGPSKTSINGNGNARCAVLDFNGNNATVLDGFTITKGYSSSGGGGVYGGTIKNCIVENCSSGSDTGGGGACHTLAYDCTFRNNSALQGGAMHFGTAYRCSFLNNSARDDGGVGRHTNFENCLMVGNSCSNVGGGNGGGAIACGTAYNCTIVKNTCKSGGIVGDGRLYNCIVYGNTAQSGPIFYSDGKESSSQTSCYTGNPGFVDYAGGNYHLAANSPCIGKGNNSYAKGGTDLDGNARIVASVVDIGCYEYGTPATIERIVARQRYPWNGLVDVSFAIKGTAGVKYVISFAAKNAASGAKLAMRTLRREDGTVANVAGEQLLPGDYRWVWDAGADMAGDVAVDCVIEANALQ